MNTSFLRSFLLALFIFTSLQVFSQTAVPFRYTESLIFVPVKINGSKTIYTFLLNTGANKTVIDSRFAYKLKMAFGKHTDSVVGTAGTEVVSLCKIRSVQCGNAIARDIEVSARPLDSFATYSGQKIDGILGTDFLKDYAIAINFLTKKLTYTSNPARVSSKGSIPFELENGIPKFKVKIDDTLHTYLHYNSGVSLGESKHVYLNLSKQQYNKLKKINPNMIYSSYIDGKGVGGNIKLQVININIMTISGYTIDHPYIVLQPEEGYFKEEDAIGFFGNNMVDKYDAVTINFPAKKLYISKTKAKPTGKSKKIIAVKRAA